MSKSGGLGLLSIPAQEAGMMPCCGSPSPDRDGICTCCSHRVTDDHQAPSAARRRIIAEVEADND